MSKLSQKDLQQAMVAKWGDEKAKRLLAKYCDAFNSSYYDDTPLERMVKDVEQLELLSEDNFFDVDLYHPEGKAEKYLHIRLFQFNNPIPLSDTLPIFKNMDLRTLNEHPYVLNLGDNVAWISDFNVEYLPATKLDLTRVVDIFKDAFKNIYLGIAENDELNKLIFTAMLPYDEITILRAYIRYLQQVGFRYSQSFVVKTVAQHTKIASDLIAYFKQRFSSGKKNDAEDLAMRIQEELDAITSLEHDQVMRSLFLLIKATLRTNYVLLKKDKKKKALAFKLQSAAVPVMPLPRPLYEIFICSPQFIGVHLRSSVVSRGGIRWSDRHEDLRTEILGLMKAQKVKNAVIVPSGAKGGFVLKEQPSHVDRKVLEQDVIDCYKQFISGLLDLTDNIEQNASVHPEDVVCYDDFDPYLVVAADKGTGNFSDIANQISKEYGFWLGDAFASGGSSGYNHKQMGITARGAWESIKRHFLDLNINTDQDDFSVVGIGDMSGDVFGNGMLYSEHISLIAAFDHRDIFIDPTPDTKKSFAERKRLFELPRSSWQDYRQELISKGGGVFSRKLKAIPLSPEMKACLAVSEDSMTPNELVRAILKAPVDLLYNGGIGTYVKSSDETHDEARDRSNDDTRIDACELRCRVVGEGGNLGVTQLGRVEFAMQGGRIFTDFIDNSGGVDCSDHEVNIKILLNQVMADGKLTEDDRNLLLQTMQNDVRDLVLKDNYQQALAINLSAAHVSHYAGLYQDYIRELEVHAELNRTIEFLPGDKTILERKAAEQGITTPEIAILLEYTKIYVKKEILKSSLPEDPFFHSLLEQAFPALLAKRYPTYLLKHRLYREIIAKQLSNQVVGELGVTFVHRQKTETGATVDEVIRAYVISSSIFESVRLESIVEDLRFKVPAKLQYELLYHVRHLLNLSTRWFLRSQYLLLPVEETIKHFSVPIKELTPLLPELMTGATKAYLDALTEQFSNAGIPREMASTIATYRAIYVFLNVIDVSRQFHLDLKKTARCYFHVGTRFNLVWFRDQIATDQREGHWNNMARLQLRDELDFLQRSLTVTILMSDGKGNDVEDIVEQWIVHHPRPMERWEAMLQLLHASQSVDYTMFFIALRELSEWVKLDLVVE